MKINGIIAAAMAAALAAVTLTAASWAAPAHAPEIERTAEEVEDIEALARMLYGEARGVESTTEQAACVWVVLNRVDDDRWPDNVIDVLSQPLQFGGYRVYFPVEDWAYDLAADVYDRWTDGRETGQDPGRVIPADYFYWRGEKGCKHNWFRKEFDDYTLETYTFEEVSPYDD